MLCFHERCRKCGESAGNNVLGAGFGWASRGNGDSLWLANRGQRYGLNTSSGQRGRNDMQ